MAAGIPYDYLWIFERKYREEGHQGFLVELYRQLRSIVPYLPLKDVRDVLKDCPDDNREAMWREWMKHNKVEQMALPELSKATKGLSNDVLALLWAKWLNHNDLSQYTVQQIDKSVRGLPRSITREVVRQYEAQRGIQ